MKILQNETVSRPYNPMDLTIYKFLQNETVNWPCDIQVPQGPDNLEIFFRMRLYAGLATNKFLRDLTIFKILQNETVSWPCDIQVPQGPNSYENFAE